MKSSILNKISNLLDRYEELSLLLSDAEVLQDIARFRDLSKEYAQMTPLVNCFKQYQAALSEKQKAEELLKDTDPSIRALASEELKETEEKIKTFEQELQRLLLPQDPHDTRNVFVEIRAGAGGDEAAIFVGNLFRMYSRYADQRRWSVEIVSQNVSEQGGYKEIIFRISGQNVYSFLKFESGVHRVQRVPETEAQGRIHTSTCTVAILPEIEETQEVKINPSELRIDTFRASGAGGQHVNRTDSAVRITHIPTGLVVECQAERSQHQNKARAMAVLQSKLLTQEQDKQRQEQVEKRRSLIGTGDRSERIRTYNYPQRRVTDHRINLSLYQLPDLLEGELDLLIQPLIQEHQADLLSDIE